MRVLRPLVLSLLLVLGGGITALSAQNREVSGKVLDANQQPLVGVAVLVDGTTKGVTTSENGTFKIQVPSGEAVLQVTCLGYLPQKVTVPSSRNSITIYLQEDAIMLDATVVIGYGTQKKVNLTGAVATVGSKELENRVTHSLGSMLQGSVAGLNITTSSGKPGSTPAINIRGVNSINSADPLVLIDGVVGDLNRVNPNDVESVSVLKDAASAAIYGARAGFGVILITTKNNADGKMRINYSGRFSVSDPTTCTDFITTGYDAAVLADEFNKSYNGSPYTRYDGDDFRQLYQRRNDRTENPDRPWVVQKNGKYMYYANFNWYDYLFDYTQPTWDHDLSISGGNDKMDYYVSGSFLEDPSYVIMSGFKRYSGRAAFNAQATKWLKVGTNLSYSRRDIDSPGYSGANTGNVFLWTMWQNPTVPYYARDLDGNIRYNADGTKMYEQGNGTTLSPYGATQDQFNSFNNFAHPVQSMSRDINNSVRDNLYANFYGEIVFLKDFKFTANFTLDNVYRMDTFYYNNEYGTAATSTNNGLVEKYNDNYFSYNTQQMLNWNKTIKEHHNFDVLIGHEFGKTDQRVVDAYKKNIFYPGIPELGNAVSQYSNGSTSSTVVTAIEGYFARVNYNYAGKYFFSGSYRYDGSSRFKYDKWGHFWSVGAAWRIKGESFMDNATWVDELKLRVNYGVAGNQLSASYPYTNLWTIGETNGQIGITQASTGNRNLSWERNYQIDLGIDFRLWNRFYGTVDYYNRRTHDLIWNRPTPSSTGLASRLENVGILANRGFEIDLGVDILKHKDLYWNFAVNASFARNRLIDYPSELGNPALGGDYISGRFLRGKGKSYYNLYLFKFAGVDPETGQETFWKDVVDGEGKVTGREKTFNINEATQYEIGDALPDVTGGFRTSFRWKNFDFMLAAAYQIGPPVGRQLGQRI